jgi:hypothetical protein
MARAVSSVDPFSSASQAFGSMDVLERKDSSSALFWGGRWSGREKCRPPGPEDEFLQGRRDCFGLKRGRYWLSKARFKHYNIKVINEIISLGCPRFLCAYRDSEDNW